MYGVPIASLAYLRDTTGLHVNCEYLTFDHVTLEPAPSAKCQQHAY
jgi:hypothetical protein